MSRKEDAAALMHLMHYSLTEAERLRLPKIICDCLKLASLQFSEFLEGADERSKHRQSPKPH